MQSDPCGQHPRAKKRHIVVALVASPRVYPLSLAMSQRVSALCLLWSSRSPPDHLLYQMLYDTPLSRRVVSCCQ